MFFDGFCMASSKSQLPGLRTIGPKILCDLQKQHIMPIYPISTHLD